MGLPRQTYLFGISKSRFHPLRPVRLAGMVFQRKSVPKLRAKPEPHSDLTTFPSKNAALDKRQRPQLPGYRTFGQDRNFRNKLKGWLGSPNLSHSFRSGLAKRNNSAGARSSSGQQQIPHNNKYGDKPPFLRFFSAGWKANTGKKPKKPLQQSFGGLRFWAPNWKPKPKTSINSPSLPTYELVAKVTPNLFFQKRLYKNRVHLANRGWFLRHRQ